MASAAAVAVDQARSPMRNDLGEDNGLPGEITSGVYSREEDLSDVNGVEDNDEDEPPSTVFRRRNRVNRDANEDGEAGEAGEPDLFGDEEDELEEEPESPARRQLDDEELDSGDDLDRTDREPEQAETEYTTQEKFTMDLGVARQPIPEPSDGEMYLLRIPEFMSIEPQAWDHTSFQPPTTDHHSSKPPSATFSSYNTAMTTIRWRHSPSDPGLLQSNARINRWSDGSLTLQLASDPTTQYEIDGNALAPPQRNPIKPTPTSISTNGPKGGRQGALFDEKYDQRKDSFTYLIRPYEYTSTLIVTHKITSSLTIEQSASVEDDAIERLQASLAAAANASKVNGGNGLRLVHIDEDPEAAKAKALEAVRQKEKADKRHQAAIDREAARSNRVSGRSGPSANRTSGLNVGMLEDDDMGEDGGRVRPSPKNRNRNPRRRRNSEYSEDEDLGRSRFNVEDEYDEEDDFVARSDEEEEVVEDDDDSDDGIVEEPRRDRTPKRRANKDDDEDDDEADAPGEDDEEEEAHHARSKRRRIVDEEDEDEEE